MKVFSQLLLLLMLKVVLGNPVALDDLADDAVALDNLAADAGAFDDFADDAVALDDFVDDAVALDDPADDALALAVRADDASTANATTAAADADGPGGCILELYTGKGCSGRVSYPYRVPVGFSYCKRVDHRKSFRLTSECTKDSIVYFYEHYLRNGKKCPPPIRTNKLHEGRGVRYNPGCYDVVTGYPWRAMRFFQGPSE